MGGKMSGEKMALPVYAWTYKNTVAIMITGIASLCMDIQNTVAIMITHAIT
jgi:hypothetical protein